MPRKWIVTGVLAVVLYVIWRKYGAHLKGAISSVTS